MFDIGWSELLVIAIVLIVVVGPKDLPPMIRAFGKTMAGFRKMAGDFRAQFDEAMKEADMDDVRQTISDMRNLNPTNSLRDAMNPLRELGNDIRSDLQRAATPPSGPATSAPVDAPAVSLDEPEMKLPDGSPFDSPVPAGVSPVAGATTATAAAAAPTQGATPAASVAPVAAVAEKPKRTRKSAAKSVQQDEAQAVAAKPKRAPRTIAAKADAKAAKPVSVAAMAAEPAITPPLSRVTAKAREAKAVRSAAASGTTAGSVKATTTTAKTPRPAASKTASAKTVQVPLTAEDTAAIKAQPVRKPRTVRPKKDEA